MVKGCGQALTVRQLAVILGCSKRQIYQLIQDERMPALKIGSLIRLDPFVVADWLRSRAPMVA
jgi:excisionase family DNA binding protein